MRCGGDLSGRQRRAVDADITHAALEGVVRSRAAVGDDGPDGEWCVGVVLGGGVDRTGRVDTLDVQGHGVAVGVVDAGDVGPDPTVADLHTYYVLAGLTPVLVHNDDGPIDLGGKSYTVWRTKDNRYRIDIEGSPSGVQMHLQERIPGVSSGDAPKYNFNPDTGDFDGMPKSLTKALSKNPDHAKSLKKAIDVFQRAQAGSGCP